MNRYCRRRGWAKALLGSAPLGLLMIAAVGCGPSANGSGEQPSDASTATVENPVEPSGEATGETPGDRAPGGEATAADAAGPDKGSSDSNPSGAASPTGSAKAGSPSEIKEITFDDINLQIQADVVFRPWMLKDAVKALDGQRVRIVGYMLPGAEIEGMTEFVLLRNTECKFGPGGQADHLIMVTLKEGETTSFRTRPVSVEGVLKINPYQGADGNTWSIYDLIEAENIETQRR